MPTGYTADVADGKVTDFRTFALRCARAFGATIMQRDDDARDEPKHREPSDYHAKQLEAERHWLAQLDAMTLADADAAAEREFQQTLADEERYRADKEAARARYEAMLAEVVLWEPPTAEHRGMKEFMEKQLRESIDFDCHEYLSRLTRKTAEEWLKNAKASARKNIGYHAKEHAEEIARCESSNRWIDALYESLPEVATAGTPPDGERAR